MMRYLTMFAISTFLVTTGAPSARAHAFDPPIVELRERGPSAVDVRILLPAAPEPARWPTVTLPVHCTAVGEPNQQVTKERRTRYWRADCGRAGLRGHRLTVSSPQDNPVDVIVRVVWNHRDQFTAVVPPSAPTILLPGPTAMAGSFFTTAVTYLGLGIEHILLGIDHLLFVLGLLLLVPSRAALLATITAFTLGHSTTLGLAMLGIATLRPAPVEAIIALSIVFLAREIAHKPEASSLARRQPWLIAAGFGLLHGFGFAGALGEIGIPDDAIPLSLAAFNLGVELGQLAFVAAILLIRAVLRRCRLGTGRAWRLAPAYAMGSMAGFWVLERIAVVVGVPMPL